MDELASMVCERMEQQLPTGVMRMRVNMTDAILPGLSVEAYSEFAQRYVAFVASQPEGMVWESVVGKHRLGNVAMAAVCMTCDDDELQEGISMAPPLQIFATHLQRQLAGYAKAMIYLAQDFMAGFAY